MDQQKILGYFIEEAKEHLETLEKGILELSLVIEDSERLNEMFRAAHSIKGGAAMLGYGSIQKTAHRLEDAFKILKDNALPIDQKLESLLLASYDILQDLTEKLQSPQGFQEEEAESLVQTAEPAFVELQDYLNRLLSQGARATASSTLTSADLPTEMRALLHRMLQLFKQEATKESRQKLQKLCVKLGQLAPQEKAWQGLVKAAENAIANPKHSYRILAPVVIKELKQGSDWIELEQGGKIVPSQGLQQLATAKLPQILVTLDPAAIANTLLQILNQQQISQLVQGLGAKT